MMARPASRPALRPMLPDDLPRLADIFRASIQDLAADDYSETQIEAWSAAVEDESAFGRSLARQLTLVATIEGVPVGFASLKDGKRLDMLYVDPLATGQGIGAMLLDALEKLARGRGAQSIAVDASDNAQDFFRKHGYAPQSRNSVLRGDEWLANTTMEKPLSAGAGRP